MGEALELGDEGALNDGMDVDFIVDVIDLMGFDYLGFAEHFDGIMFACLFVFGHFNNSKATFHWVILTPANDPAHLVIGEAFLLEL